MKILFLICLLVSNAMFSQNELKHEVYFDTAEHIIPEIEQNRLLLFIQKLGGYGFCDDVGSELYNLNLSQQRANAIKDLFSSSNIDGALITNVDGKGEILLKVVAAKDANVIRSLNRRVEISVQLKPAIKEIVVVKKETKKKLRDALKVGDKIVLENILFEIGYRTVIPESKKILEEIAEILINKKNIYFTIQGHVCCTQNSRDAVDVETKKQNLSLVRAKYIYNYLAKKGVAKKRMKYVGMRRKFPLGGDPKFDRRVEILVTYISKKNN